MGKYLLISIVGIVSLVSEALSYYFYRRKRLRNELLIPMRRVGTVNEISFSPLSAGVPNLLDQADCSEYGMLFNLVADHCLMLYNDSDEPALPTCYPRILGIRIQVKDDSTLTAKAPKMRSIDILLHGLAHKPISVIARPGLKIYRVSLERRHHEWFSMAVLNRPSGMRLYCHLRTRLKNITSDKVTPIPIVVLSRLSLNSFNQRLAPQNAWNEFGFHRNILINASAGVKAFEEENWRYIVFGEVKTAKEEQNCVLRYICPCLSYYAEKNMPGYFHLHSLERQHGLVQDEIPYGECFIVEQRGIIKLNDPVYVI